MSTSAEIYINALELRAVRRMLEDLRPQLRDKHVRVFADKTMAVSSIGKGGSARPKPFQEEAEAIWELTNRPHIMLSIRLCPGVHNTEAD